MVAKIKFCGMMQGQDAAAAVDVGAGYLGVVFASGPRRVSEQQAREVVAAAAEVPVAESAGGHRRSLDLPLAVEARHRIVGSMVLAGGLRPDNVGAALASVRPDIVDVSSGVEHRPGIKDPQKMKHFTEAVVAHSTDT